MNVKTFSYRFAEEILQHENYREIYDEIINICEICPIPKYQGKSKVQKQKDIVQQTMNSYFSIVLEKDGWEKEPLATPNNSADALRSDFRKKYIFEKTKKEMIVQIEVEFGNVASSYRNYFKFQLSFSYGLTDVCILIVPSYHLSTRIDSGVTNYEKVLRELPAANLSITVPVLVIGLFDQDDNGVDLDCWDMKQDGIPLGVAKNESKKVYNQHREIIKDYIADIKNKF